MIGRYSWLQVLPDLPRGTKVDSKTEPNNESGSFQPLMEVGFNTQFTLSLKNGQNLESFKAIEILVGSSDPERQGLSMRRMKRLLAPQSQENPIYFHMTNGTSQAFRSMVDQLVEVGFEMIFYSFGSRFDPEDTEKFSQYKADFAYANSKGLEVGSYDLIAWTRKVPDQKWAAITNSTFGACMNFLSIP